MMSGSDRMSKVSEPGKGVYEKTSLIDKRVSKAFPYKTARGDELCSTAYRGTPTLIKAKRLLLLHSFIFPFTSDYGAINEATCTDMLVARHAESMAR